MFYEFYDVLNIILGDRSCLKENSIPTVFKFRNSITDESPRAKRYKSREVCDDLSFQELDNLDIQCETEVTTMGESSKPESCCPNTCDEEIQCEIPSSVKYSIDNFRVDDRAILYYTGFDDFDHYMMFFYCLGPAAFELKYQCSLLHPKDQLFMTLMKLRQAKDDVELALLFKVSESTVSRVIVQWINFLYFQLKELNIWPSKDIVEETMPVDFKRKFPKTRVILDATEVPIQKPSHVNCQSVTWSNYKHKNTLKTMIGCSPKGAVTFISDSYGGSASDRQIIEKSCLLDPTIKMFEKGDSIMADRGIMVQDLFACRDVAVNTPTFLKGKSQLEAHEVVKDRRISSKRIHIERIIGLSKSYKILKHGIPCSKILLGSRIVFICFAISNFRKCIVHKNA